jgi:Lectin C-type domain
MLRATRALAAMLTLGALACTFDHSGGQPGSDDGGTGDAADESTEGSSSDAEAGDPNTDEGGNDDANPDGSSPGDDDAAQDSPSRPDGNPLPSDAQPTDDGGSDGMVDGSGPEQDARLDCAAVSGSTFTPPDASGAHCYWLHGTAANWLGAANACAAERGHLVTIDSSAETTFVLGLVTAFPSDDRLWIGATDGHFSSEGPGSGPFVWITGEPMTYTNWASSGPSQQPDGLCQMCGTALCQCEHRVATTNDGHWEDLYEGLYYRFVCEAEL